MTTISTNSRQAKTLKSRLKLAKSKKLKRSSRMAKAVGMNKSFRRDSEKTIKINVQVPSKSALKDFRTVQYTPALDSNISMTVFDDATLQASGYQLPATFYYNSDERMSVRNLTDSSAAVVQSYDYTAYGDKVDSLTSGAVTQRYTYTGRELNETSGDYYFRYRMYGAQLGGFLSRDPYLDGYQDGLSAYHGYFAQWLGTDPGGLDFIAVGTRRLEGFEDGLAGWVPGLNHMSIEYYQEPCDDETGPDLIPSEYQEGHHFTDAGFDAVMIDAFELLNDSESFQRTYRRYRPKPRGGGEWVEVTEAVSISVIRRQSTATRRVVILTGDDDEVEEDWRLVENFATNYLFAEQHPIGRTLTNWSQSWYGIPIVGAGRPPNNSNTFIRGAAQIIGRNADNIGGLHPGNDFPDIVEDPGWTPTPVP
ncbi:hypothetical protein BVX99_02200 [bacterium F16]|nr:hypothetical protein BVX99_02200 [bacterium F16]